MLGCTFTTLRWDITRDSRGIFLEVGDLVLYLNYMAGQWNGTVCVVETIDGHRNILVNMNGDGVDICTHSWFIKLSMTKDEYLEYCDNIGITDMVLNTNRYEVTQYARFLRFNYKKSKNIDNVAGLRDLFDRKLEPGSLVLYTGRQQYSSNADTLSYGIVVSEKEIFTEYLTIVSPYNVLLMTSFNEKEQDIYGAIVRQYKQQAIKSSGDIKIGDIYRVGSMAYLYLGKCEIVCTKLSDCNALMEYAQDNTKGRWLNLGKLDVHSIEKLLRGDRMYLSQIMQRCFKSVQIERKKYRITEDFYTTYMSICDFKSLAYELEDVGVYVGNVQLYTPIHYEVDKEKTILFHFDIELKIYGENLNETFENNLVEKE